MICSGHAMQTLCYFVLCMSMSMPTKFYCYNHNYIYIFNAYVNILSTIDNIVIKPHRREMHNKNCDFLNSSIIFSPASIFFTALCHEHGCHSCLFLFTTVVQIEKEIKNKYNDLCLKNNQG